jgi:hypothetical protein
VHTVHVGVYVQVSLYFVTVISCVGVGVRVAAIRTTKIYCLHFVGVSVVDVVDVVDIVMSMSVAM